MHRPDAPDEHRLIVERLSPRLAEALWRIIRNEQRDDVLAPVTVVAPTRYAGLALRQALGSTGFANVRFMPLPVLSELLGAAVLEREGRKPLTAVLETLTVRRILAQSSGPLAAVWEHPSTQASVRAAFRQLRNTDPAFRAALASRGGVTGEIARLHEAFLELTAGEWYDIEALAEAAAKTVRQGEAPGLQDLGLIVFYLPHGLLTGQATLLETLVEHHRCAVLLGTTGDADADASTADLANRIRSAAGLPVAVTDRDDEPSAPTADVRLHVAPTPHEELRWVIRQIIREVNANGTALHRLAILYRLADPYAALIRDELRMAGLPMAGPDRETLSNTGPGRTLRGLLDLAGGQFQRSEVMAWLSGCPVRPPVGSRQDFNPSQWDTVTRNAGIVGGLRQWLDRLDAYSRRLRADAERRETAGEISVSRARGMRSEAAAADSIRAFIEKLAEDLEPPPDGSPWAEFGTWAKGLLGDYLDIDGADDLAADRIRQTLDEFNAADSVHGGASLDVFRQMVDEMLQVSFDHLGPTGRGVFVSSFAGAAGMDFDAVWMVGMIEGAVPPAARRDPLLTEPDWLAAGGPDRLQARMAEERYEFLAAMASAYRRTLSYPIAHAASQREAYPSRWLLEQATQLEGAPVRSGGLAGLSARDWLTIDASAPQALAKADDMALADDHDYRLQRLLEWRGAQRDLPSHPFAQRGSLAGAVRLAYLRSARQLTEFDGNLSALAVADRFSIGSDGSPISPTALETWATCPYRYFLGHILRLRALETPEEIVTISALDRGSMIHEILETFISERVATGSLPAAGQPWTSDDRERLMRIAAANFAAAEAQGLTGKRLLWDMVKAEIISDLETFLEADAQLRMTRGTTDVSVEARFGFGGDSIEVIDQETGISFRGAIDRIDLSADGRTVLVVDYKTGSATPFEGLDDDPIDQGRHLQLGVYSLAAREMFPQATDVAAAYWFSTNRGNFRFAPADHFNITDESVAARFREGVGGIVAGINSGAFPANPGPPARYGPANCQYCDFNSLCPSRRRDLWERKKSDPVVSTYLRLAEGDGEVAA